MSKALKELAAETTESQLAEKIRELANQIWLAGLGAFSKAQQEGVKMFELSSPKARRFRSPSMSGWPI